MKNRIVFVDTNVVDGDKSFNHLLGNRRKLTELAKSADLVIPKVVIDELINHKLHIYQSEKRALRGFVWVSRPVKVPA